MSAVPDARARVALVLCLVLGGVVGGTACARAAGREPAQGVLLIAIDGLRADHLSSMGYDRPTTPTLDQLASEGLLFEQAFTASPQLLPSHASLATGCDPSIVRRFLPHEFEGLQERRWRIPARVPHLAIELLTAGYATAAFLDDSSLDPVYGFGPGFQVYEVLGEESRQDWEGAQPARLVDHLLLWLRALDSGSPWFAYLHLAELERFWGAPDEQWDGYFHPRAELSEVPPVGNTDSVFFAIPRSRWPGGSRPLSQYEASYDGHLRYLDGELGRLFASLRRMGRFERTTIHVVGTFGTQFGEAGLYLRGGRYSMADLHVPWIVRPREGPGNARGRRTDALASLLDVAPTLLELEGLKPPQGMHGLSQAAFATSASMPEPRERFVFASCGMQEGCAVIGERYCMEFLIPDSTDDAQLRRSWYGEWIAPAISPHLRFYDRLSTPYPPLQSGPPWFTGEDFERFRQAARERLRDMNDLRLHLQSRPGASPLDAAKLQELRDKGFLGAGR